MPPVQKSFSSCVPKFTSSLSPPPHAIHKRMYNALCVHADRPTDRPLHRISIPRAKNRPGVKVTEHPRAVKMMHHFIHFQDCSGECRAKAMKSTEDFWSKKKFGNEPAAASSASDQWLLGRQRLGKIEPKCRQTRQERPQITLNERRKTAAAAFAFARYLLNATGA